MSFESVRKKCIANSPGGDISKLDDSINVVTNRFVKIVKTSYNEEMKGGFFYSNQPTLAKNAYFEKYKLEYIHKHLEMLIDLYDYKPPSSLK